MKYLFDASKCEAGEHTINIQLNGAYKICKIKHL